jgi:hypothetical protein
MLEINNNNLLHPNMRIYMPSDSSPTVPKKNLMLLPLGVDVDLIDDELNLNKVGFFLAYTPRKRERPRSRKVSSTINRDGVKIDAVLEFRTSDLGLPSTADKDKWKVLQKLMAESKAKYGKVENPFRFSGYRMLQELGLKTNAGKNYDALVEWCQRMTDTTISSKHVIYYAARRKYADTTIHVFKTFRREGAVGNDGSGRTETFVVELEDWLLENINLGYVGPVDFAAYRGLTRDISKGIFDSLHYWFSASPLQFIRKDYRDLCNFFGLTEYKSKSKILETLGPSLDELVKIKYISTWSLDRMSSKDGYMVVVYAGDELLRILTATGRRKALTAATTAPISKELTDDQKKAIDSLVEHGISPTKATSLAQTYDPQTMLQQMDYALSLIEQDGNMRRRIANPPGFIIYHIEQNFSVPAAFLKQKLRRHESEKQVALLRNEDQLNVQYVAWKERQIQIEIDSRFTPDALRTIIEKTAHEMLSDPVTRRFSADGRKSAARAKLARDIATELLLPDFQSWKVQYPQGELFQ